MSTITEQRHLALERANEVRLARAELKRRIARGEIPAVEVILNPPPEAEGWAIFFVLTAQRRWGATAARRLLRHLDIAETKHLGGLTCRQREAIAHALRLKSGRSWAS